MMNREASYARKLQLLRGLLEVHGKTWMRLTTQRSLAWLTGMRSFINIASVDGCAELWVSRDEVVAVANHIESRRLVEEELAGLALEMIEHPWYEPEQRLNNWVAVGSDLILVEAQVEQVLLRYQSIFDDYEQQNLSVLAEQTAQCVETVARECRQGESEFALAGRLAHAFWTSEIEPIVLLVAADDRAYQRRHPLPTAKPIEKYVMLVACGRRNGLVASVTRSVHFGPVPDSLLARQTVASYVDAVAIAASQPGATLGEVMVAVEQAYTEKGWSEEWKEHHQGGLTGYLSRTRLGRRGDDFLLGEGMAVAWNPSVAGSKSEDTCLLRPTGAQVVSVCAAADWPTRAYDIGTRTVLRPEILVRKTSFA